MQKTLIYNTRMQDLIRQLLVELGEDPAREGLLNTPLRVEKAMKFLTSGYAADIDAVLNEALFTVDYNEMVIVKDIDFYSLCEHHLLPFFGKCHVAYIPRKQVIGLSKIPRLVEVFARRLQIQERMTNQIAETIREKINPLGVAVVVEGTHLCMSMRGVEKQNSFAVTSAMLGAFRDNARTRMEFLELVKLRGAGGGGGGGGGRGGGARRSSRRRRPGMHHGLRRRPESVDRPSWFVASQNLRRPATYDLRHR
jgi:GTP cyclohydrolase I